MQIANLQKQMSKLRSRRGPAAARRNFTTVGNAGCSATPWQATPAYGPGQGAQYDPNIGFAPSLPQNAPFVDPGLLVNPYQVIEQNYVPLGFRVQAAVPGGTPLTVEVFPFKGLYYIAGIKIFNDPGIIEILRFESGGSGLPRNAAPFDAAAYNTLEPFSPVDFGCISNQQPLTITFAAFGTPSEAPFLNGVLFGTQQQSWNSCYPAIGTALGLSPSVYGNPTGGIMGAPGAMPMNGGMVANGMGGMLR